MRERNRGQRVCNLDRCQFPFKSLAPETSLQDLSDSTKEWGHYREEKWLDLWTWLSERAKMWNRDGKARLKINISLIIFFPRRSLWRYVYSFIHAASTCGCACVELLGVLEVSQVCGNECSSPSGVSPPQPHTIIWAVHRICHGLGNISELNFHPWQRSNADAVNCILPVIWWNKRISLRA